MTGTLGSRLRVEDVLDAVRRLMPEIEARAPEVESARRVPLDLLDQLKAAGCFRVLLPETHGGAGADLGSAMRVFEEISRADASVAWIVLVGGVAWVDLSGLKRSTFDSIYRPGVDTVVAGAFNPTGNAVPVKDGYRVDGRWAFASGCEHADWLYGNCVDTSSGEPQLRTAVFQPDEVEIEDTWSVSGLCGTGSHHFNVKDVVVPGERTSRVFVDPPCVDVPLVRVPVPATIALSMASVPLGIARAALDDVIALATEKVPLLAPAPLASNPRFQYELADADAKLRAARALLHTEADAAWATAAADDEFTPALRARLRSAAVLAVTDAASVVDMAYGAAGGSSLYSECSLQRRLRDVRAVTQHFLFRPDTLTTCGAVLAGQAADLTVF
jgi:alkylation response protein AidB-like acyl-CoA dehydrogenase